MHKRKLTPCSMHNTSKLELWFDKMASEGFILDQEGYKNTYARFNVTDPQIAFHRIWPKEGFNHFNDVNNLRKKFGFEFVSSSAEYDIYRSYDEKALLIDYDSENIRFVNKAARKRIICQTALTLFYLISFLLIALITPCIIVLSPTGIFSSAILLIVSLSEIIRSVRNIFMIVKLKNRNEKDNNISSVNWKKESLKHQIPNIIYIILLFIFLFVNLYGESIEPVSKSLPEDKSEIPFATVIDFTNDKDSYISQATILNKYENWKTPVAESNYEWKESARIISSDGNEIKCSLFVDYHETVHPLLAKAVAKLYNVFSRLSHDPFESYGDCPRLNYDYEVMIITETDSYIYILQNNNTIIQIKLICSSETAEESELIKFRDNCVRIIADSIKG